jgi:hypothetical protein
MPTLTGARWTSKPPPGTDLDRTHPACPDHCWPFLSPQGTAKCLAKAAPLRAPVATGDIVAGSSTMVRTRKYGLAVRHGATSDLLRYTADEEADKVIPLSGGWTVLLAYRKTDATLRGVSAFGINTSTSTTYVGVHGLPYSDGNVYFRFGGLTEGATQITVAGLTVGDDLWTFSTGPRGMEVWQNGLLRGSNAGNPSRTSAGTALPFLWPSFAPVNSDLADVALMMSWRRQLPAAAIRALSVNPWLVFQPPTLVVLVPGPEAPAIYGPSVSRFPSLTIAP